MTTVGKDREIVNNKAKPSQAQSIMDFELRAKRDNHHSGKPRIYRCASPSHTTNGVPIATLHLECHTLEMARLYQRDGGSRGAVQVLRGDQWQGV